MLTRLLPELSLATIHTIGHSIRALDELVAALQAHGIGTLVDIRSFPMSRRLPHFNRESLQAELPKQGIAYVWMKELGGRRKKIRDDSPHTGLRSASFRNYADYMLTPEFEQAIARLLAIAKETADSPATGSGQVLQQAEGKLLSVAAKEAPPPLGMTDEKQVLPAGGRDTAIMCAERVYFQCHRMLVSDYLTAHGHTVMHIEDDKHPPRQHKLMAEAHLVKGQLLYNAQELF